MPDGTSTTPAETNRESLRKILQSKLRSKKAARNAKHATFHKMKSQCRTESGREDMLNMAKQLDMDAMCKMMGTRHNQRKLKNFTSKMGGGASSE
jgi:hypothetical protein